MNRADKILRILTVMVGILIFGRLFFMNGGVINFWNSFLSNTSSSLEQELKEDDLAKTQLKKLPAKIPQTRASIGDRVGIEEHPSIETDLPSPEVFRLAGDANDDINHWKQVLIEEDRDAYKYIVVPANWLVVPINEFSEDSQEFDKMINGREVDINSALETGALEYPGTSINGYGEEWTKMVFAHSSYWKGEEGRYKTHFQKIIELSEWEQVWIYVKNPEWNYDQYKYEIEESYNTSEYDTSIFLPQDGKNLTLFTCTPIGGTEGRWIIKAKYLDTSTESL